MGKHISRAENRRRWADKFDRRDGPPVGITASERDYVIDMKLGSRALVKSILATGKTHTQLTADQLEALKLDGLL